MAYKELDMTISDEAKATQREIRDFAMNVVRPAGIKLDALPYPSDVIDKSSVLWDVFAQFRKMKIHQAGIPKELGGLGEIDPMISILMYEELGYGDAGLAVSLFASSFPFAIAAQSPDPELQELARAYCADTEGKLVGCSGFTEPTHGSDMFLDDPGLVPSVRAVKKGDEYVINGQKAAWVSNGTIATHAVLFLNLEPSMGMQGNGLAFVPLNLPGVSKAKPLNKVGQRALNQGEIFFDDVKIPRSYMIISDPAMGTLNRIQVLVGANTWMGTVFTGLAQAAFDEALNYAKNRVQGGKQIFEHQSIKLRLFNLFTMVESTRAFTRRTALYNFANPTSTDPTHATASKVLATETAFNVASEAIQIFGGNGLAKEYIIEKLLRDAKASMIEDGENNLLSIRAADQL